MSGLDNPRGLALGPDGGVYVAEAGRGGTGATIVTGEGAVQYGTTGAVSRLLGGNQQRVITGLPSLASQAGPSAGGDATGLVDIGFNAAGDLFGVIGLGADPATRAGLGADGPRFARLVRLPVGGAAQNVADIGAFETASNPDGGLRDTNPYGLLVTATGFVVADAGGNSLLDVTPAGVVSTRSVFPNRPNPLPPPPPTYQAVPTTVTVGPDGALRVGQLTGFPFAPGAANVYRIDPATGVPTVEYGGFTNIIDLAYAPDGSLYVLQIDTNGLASPLGPGPGQLIRVEPGTGARTTVLSDPLLFPGGLLITPGGSIYVSNLAVSAGGGQVLLVPEPATAAVLVAGVMPPLLLRARRRRVV
jgi:sugar lactone lactonase YvrE